MSPDAFRDWRDRQAYTLDAAARALGLSRLWKGKGRSRLFAR